MESLNWIAIGVVTVANFILGAIWYGPIFGKQWEKIHHGAKGLSKTEKDAAEKDMWQILIPEFISTAIIIVGLAYALALSPNYTWWHVALFVWFFFTLPFIASIVLWGVDKKSVMAQKITIAAAYRLIALVGAAYVISIW
jgi:Protein of unknown function (DUF1761)